MADGRLSEEVLGSAQDSRGHLGPTPRPEVHLTSRELEYLQAIADGETYAQIGERLGVMGNTVANAVKYAKRKMGLKTTAQMIATLVRQGRID